MEVKRTDTDTLNSVISIILTKEDYMPKVQKDLKEMKDKVQMKGFRKGKTPMGLVRKMYGPSVMIDVINKAVQEHLFHYLEEQKLNVLGYPLPNKDQKMFDFDVNIPEDYEFLFDIGIVPHFDIQGADDNAEYAWYDTQIPSEFLDEQMEQARKKVGSEVEVEDAIREDDALMIEAWEYEDGKIKEGGFKTDFRVLAGSLADGPTKDQIMASSKGARFVFDIFHLEKNSNEKYVRKYLLKLEDEDETEVGSDFEGEIMEIRRIEPAEINQEFFENVFGPGLVSSEEEARELFRSENKSFYDRQADEYLFNEMYERIMESNQVELPVDFLRRWLNETNEKELSDQEFSEVKKSYRWSVIRNRLMEDLGITIEKEDIQAGFRQKLRQYMQGYSMDDSFFDSMIDRMMKDKEQVDKQVAEVSVDKLFRGLKAKVKIEKKEIGMDEFKAFIQKENEKAQKVSADLLEEEE